MGPDYASYDATQLHQALRTIDADRFPERVEEIKARLVALAQAAQATCAMPAGALPDRSLDLPILRRAGKVLVAVGLIDIAAMIYFVVQGQSYSSSLNLFALIPGILLWRGGLRAASAVRWIGWSMLPAALILPIVFLAGQPWDLTMTQVRLFPGGAFLSTALTIGYVALLLWLVRELGRGPVLAARVAAGRKLRDMRIPAALGGAGSAIAVIVIALLLSGERAHRAEATAAAKLGAGYRYHVNSIGIVTVGGVTATAAMVVAWNANAVLAVPVTWHD